jgi:hypothetical protein
MRPDSSELFGPPPRIHLLVKEIRNRLVLEFDADHAA